jgi:hypothetical protein
MMLLPLASAAATVATTTTTTAATAHSLLAAALVVYIAAAVCWCPFAQLSLAYTAVMLSLLQLGHTVLMKHVAT